MSHCKETCNSCNPCGPAAYDMDISVMLDPFNEDIWNFTINGKLFHLHMPPRNETDTTLSDNYSNATLIYSAEKHVDTLTGNQ